MLPDLPPPVLSALTTLLKEGKLDLPVLPDTAARVVQLCGDDRCESKTLADLIGRDQGLAGNLMRLANSPMYCGNSPIVSLNQAVARLGFGKIRELALIISCQAKVFAVPGQESWVKEQFRHALCTGLYAQELARCKRMNVEEGFLCGLLHDVGRPVLMVTLLDLHRNCKLPPSMPGIHQTIEALHAAVGGQLVTSWTLPARLGETIRHHHHPAKAEAAQQTAWLANFADDIAQWAMGTYIAGDVLPTDDDIRGHAALADLNLYPEQVDALMEQRERICGLVKSFGG